MSEDKIQQLTQTLLQEGVQEGEKRAEEIIERARKRGAEIIDDARAKADEIIEEARLRSSTLKEQVETEINIAAREIIHDIRHKVTDMVVARAPGEGVGEALNNNELVSDLIIEMVKKWEKDQEHITLEVILPEVRREQLEEWFRLRLDDHMQKGLKLSFSPHIKGGFQVVPEGSAYKIEFSEEGFLELFQKYLKPRARRIIFGE